MKVRFLEHVKKVFNKNWSTGKAGLRDFSVQFYMHILFLRGVTGALSQPAGGVQNDTIADLRV